MNKRKAAALGAAIAAAGVIAPFAIAAATTADPAVSITGAGNSDGTLVTWTITVSGLTGSDLTSTSGFTLLFPSHPAGSTTSIDPAGAGPVLTVTGNGSVSFTESPPAGTTFCGENIDIQVDLLEGSSRIAGDFGDVPGAVHVTCVPPTTTTTTTVPPSTTTTTTVPPTTSTTTTVPTTQPTAPDGTTPTTAPSRTLVGPAPRTPLPAAQPQTVLAPPPAVTG